MVEGYRRTDVLDLGNGLSGMQINVELQQTEECINRHWLLSQVNMGFRVSSLYLS